MQRAFFLTNQNRICRAAVLGCLLIFAVLMLPVTAVLYAQEATGTEMTAQETAQKAAQEIAQEAEQEIAQETAQEIAQETAQEIAQEAAQESQPETQCRIGERVIGSKGKAWYIPVTRKLAFYLEPVNKNAKEAVVPAAAVLCGRKYKVWGIAHKAFYQNRKLKKVTIGKNVRSIGKKAFYGCTRLKRIVVKTTHLRKIGKSAFSRAGKKAAGGLRVKVPRKMKKAYLNMLRKAGLPRKASVHF